MKIGFVDNERNISAQPIVPPMPRRLKEKRITMSDELKLESVDALEDLQSLFDILVVHELDNERAKESVVRVRDYILKKDKEIK